MKLRFTPCAQHAGHSRHGEVHGSGPVVPQRGRIALLTMLALCMAIAPCIAVEARVTRPALPVATTKEAAQDGVPRWMCFPVERLPQEKRRRAEQLLLSACDSEALYTIVGGLKPMSTGWVQASFKVDNPDVAALEELREIVAHLQCGDEITAELSHFARPLDGKVALQGAFFHRPALRDELARRADFWHKWAFTPRTQPLEILLAVEYAPAAERFRGYGYLFGYPQHAVDFFVQASAQQDADPEKKLVPRDFLHIPTIARETNRFVYAVPKGQAPNAEDIALRERAAPILAEYRKRRAQYIGPGKPGIARLLRDWFDNGDGRCSPRFARF